jgi:ABC-type metal ion transport system, ATPase component
MIELEHVSLTFKEKGSRHNAVEALKDINLSIQNGDIFGIIGYSGAGKSTLIRTINALLKPTSGRIIIDNKPIDSFSERQLRHLRKKIGMVFQHFDLLNSKTVFNNVALPLILEKKSKQEIRTRVTELLKFVGLTDKEKNYPNELSGGQKQRIGIARALALNPSILLCDEATSALDPQTTESILHLLKEINGKYQITIVLITHEMSVIQKICNQVAVLEKGRIIESGSVLDVFGNPQQLATQHFVQTVIHDELPANIERQLLSLKNKDPDRFEILVKLKFIGKNATDPLIDRLVRQFDVHPNILFATMTEIENTTLGHMILKISGSEEQVNQAIHYLKTQGIFAKEVKVH